MTGTVSGHKNIYEAILGVMGDVGYVTKTQSDKLGYSYASEAELIAAVRPSMIAHGIVMFVLFQEPLRDVFTTKSGSVMNTTFTKAVIRFLHVESGTYQDVSALGEGMDTGDKSANKAMTGAFKYAIRQTFVLETGDDPDAHPSKGMERKKKEAGSDKELERVKSDIFAECKAKGGEENKELIALLDSKLGGHVSKSFAGITTVAEALSILEEIKKIKNIK